MVEIIIVSHGNYAFEIVNIIEMINGKKHSIIPFALKEQESLEAFEKRLKEFIDNSSFDEHLILIDFLGGTPFNAMQKLVMSPNIEIITGVNIPMVLNTISCYSNNLKEMSKKAEEYGKCGIVNISEKVKSRLNEQLKGAESL